MNIFTEISLLLAVTTLFSIGAKFLKQPLVVGYILAGIVIGPYFLNILTSQHELELFSKIGIVFLLFIVGLHLNPKVIKEVGKVSLITGIGQVLFTSLIGFGLAIALGIDRIAALYISIALTFSSTIIILKLLADKKDLQKLYAKIAIGFLLVQDILATIILIGITVFANQGTASLAETIGFTLAKGFGLIIVLFLISNVVLHKFTRFLAQSQELLFLFSLAWGTGMASLFTALGFSIEIGALIAGVTLSVTPYADEMSARLKPLRDFFIIIFFILLGSQMVLDNIGAIIVPALIFSVFVLVGNPIIVVILMNVLGYNQRTGFMAGLTVAQISEFSLILASLGLRVGHLSQEMLSLVTLVGLLTIAGSTYLILYSEKIYPRLSRVLNRLELVKKKSNEKGVIEEDYPCILFGYDRVGHTFTKVLSDIDEKYLVVDFNPHSIHRMQDLEISHLFGDAGDIEFLEQLPTTKPKLIISTIPDVSTNMLIIKHMLSRNPKAIVIPIAHTIAEAAELYSAGASYVIMPHYLGAEYAATLVHRLQLDKPSYQKKRLAHIQQLQKLNAF